MRIILRNVETEEQAAEALKFAMHLKGSEYPSCAYQSNATRSVFYAERTKTGISCLLSNPKDPDHAK